MSNIVQFNSQVDDDGVLDIHIDLGQAQAKKRVFVTVETAPTVSDTRAERMDWHEFIECTYGSLAGLGVERHEQGSFEQRESIE